jgi:hypothetical protein
MAKHGRPPESTAERLQRAIEARRVLDEEMKKLRDKGLEPSRQRAIPGVLDRLNISKRTLDRLLAEASRPVLISASRADPPARAPDTGRQSPRERRQDTGRLGLPDPD